MQRWSEARRFPGRIVMKKRESALVMVKEWRGPNTVWTDGSRQEDGRVGAACVWRTQEGWTGRRFQLGSNKEVFDAEVFAIYQAPRVVGRRQEGSHWHTVFVDSTAAIGRVRADALGPVQRFAIAAMEVCGRVRACDNEVIIR